MHVELMIENRGILYFPMVEEGITWSTERQGVPGQLEFTVLKDGNIDFQEGNAVVLRVDGKDVFYGFVFTKKRGNGDTISVTAYDQLRYLKNKDTYKFENKTAGEIIQEIAEDFNLQTGELEDTGYKIASRVENNSPLFDMILEAMKLTTDNTKELFVMYDDFGKITLKNISSMRLDILIDEETGENFDYTSSIDSATYNRIRLFYPKESNRPPVELQSDASVDLWGVLQLTEELQEGENGEAKAVALLSLYNAKTRSLSIAKAVGDSRVRAGCMLVVLLNLGDIKLENYMIVEKCKHTFHESEHFMDLTLKGGEFLA